MVNVKVSKALPGKIGTHMWSTRYGVTILTSPLVDDLWKEIFVNTGICSCTTRQA